MKRSEMVKFITTELFYGSLSARVDSDDVMITELAEKDAQAVLKLVEKLGMLPPTIRMKETHAGYNQFGEQSGTYTALYDRNQWESEDDLP